MPDMTCGDCAMCHETRNTLYCINSILKVSRVEGIISIVSSDLESCDEFKKRKNDNRRSQPE